MPRRKQEVQEIRSRGRKQGGRKQIGVLERKQDVQETGCRNQWDGKQGKRCSASIVLPSHMSNVNQNDKSGGE